MADSARGLAGFGRLPGVGASSWSPARTSKRGVVLVQGLYQGTTPQMSGFLADLKAENAKAWELGQPFFFHCSFLRLDWG